MLNKAIIQGRLVADPELKHTQSGAAVASFRVACDRDFKGKDPNAQSADFINIVAWRSTAEFICRFFSKGSMILLEGRIQVREYTDNNGQRRYVTEVVAESVNFCGKKETTSRSAQSAGAAQGSTYQQTSTQQYATPQGSQQQQFAEMDDDDGVLPF